MTEDRGPDTDESAADVGGADVIPIASRRVSKDGMPPEAGHIDRLIYPDVTVGDGYAVGHIEDFGAGYGFRKARKGLGVTAFGVNVLVRPPGYETKWHYHDIQEELYFVHQGSIEMEFADGTTHLLTEGTFARVDASTPRKIKVLGPGETIYVCAGGKNGYVGHDGRTPEGM
jgi:mannose-6-phosphate isomerase-like protein (cupin superfamily)